MSKHKTPLGEIYSVAFSSNFLAKNDRSALDKIKREREEKHYDLVQINANTWKEIEINN